MPISTVMGGLAAAGMAGNVLGGLTSAGGASAAGATAANAGRIAQDQLVAAGDNAARSSWQNANLYNEWIDPGIDAYRRMAAESSAGARGDSTAQVNALATIKGSPLYRMLAPVIGETFTESPSYQFRLEQGRNALANSASARGMTLSGPQAKALTDYNQGSASQEYDNWLRNYGNLALSSTQDYGNTQRFLANTGFQARDRNVQTNQQGVNYGFAGYQAGVPQYVQGQNALAGSQAAAGNTIGQTVSGLGNSLTSLGAFGYGQGWFGNGGGAGNFDANANVSGFTRGQGPRGPGESWW